MTDVEESRYFNAAKDQLDSQGDSTPTKQTIIRKKSSSRFFYPIEVPYSEEVVRETSPQKPDYTNTSQLHVLRRTNEAFWTSSAAIVPQTDLRSLTRSVSKDNGTLSQSVRRRSSLRFQSPMKVSDRW
jgi:protein tyrosine phosphatase